MKQAFLRTPGRGSPRHRAVCQQRPLLVPRLGGLLLLSGGWAVRRSEPALPAVQPCACLMGCGPGAPPGREEEGDSGRISGRLVPPRARGLQAGRGLQGRTAQTSLDPLTFLRPLHWHISRPLASAGPLWSAPSCFTPELLSPFPPLSPLCLWVPLPDSHCSPRPQACLTGTAVKN